MASLPSPILKILQSLFEHKDSILMPNDRVIVSDSRISAFESVLDEIDSS